jgi:rare lipoprotein A
VVPVALALWLPAVAGALLLAACGSTPKQPSLYREDGPPERVPANLAATPDAVPRDEPLNPYANRPYAALGRTYVPDTSGAPFHQRGMASWYGRQFQGNRTASGEPYDMFAMTAAHPTLPIPSYARVTSVRDGRSVIVRINDRGPFLHDRIIDLSYAAATRLGLAGAGSGEVEIDRILPTQIARAAPSTTVALTAPVPPGTPAGAPLPSPAPAGQGPGASLPSPAPAGQGPGVRVGAEGTAVALAVPPPGSASVHDALPATPAPADPPARAARAETPPAAVQPAPAGERWSVQVGAFKVAANAEALRDRLALLLASPEAASLPPELRAPRIQNQGGFSRVLIGDAVQRAVAQQWSRLLERYLARPTALFAH